MTLRRSRGEGSIMKRSDGRWMAQVDLGWQDGKRRRKTLSGRTNERFRTSCAIRCTGRSTGYLRFRSKKPSARSSIAGWRTDRAAFGAGPWSGTSRSYVPTCCRALGVSASRSSRRRTSSRVFDALRPWKRLHRSRSPGDSAHGAESGRSVGTCLAQRRRADGCTAASHTADRTPDARAGDDASRGSGRPSARSPHHGRRWARVAARGGPWAAVGERRPGDGCAVGAADARTRR